MTKKRKKSQAEPKVKRRAGLLKPTEGEHTVFLPMAKGSVVTSDYTSRVFISHLSEADILELKASIEAVLKIEQPIPEPQEPEEPNKPMETEDLLF